MKQFHGLDTLCQSRQGWLKPQDMASLLLKDLYDCQCQIFGCIEDNDKILLATLHLLPDDLSYEMFDQRIDLIVAGPILRNDCVPLTYRLQGKAFGISGRCSVIAKVCGVDLYLQRSYTCEIGDIARQKFSIDIKSLLKMKNFIQG
ncbi:hypothetical protein A1359_14750 [Methylomonas lenta]|uniref:Uncharacterized protein n=1 Tax=Methylomonas lenta TaxID=980561 RepID=A0A177N2G8_9GAMM|nr:hypothetical protein [Methylomonas lenta]OAI11400.1 hypothetical protein A1359_14750 [Methylomonas lenta]